MGADAKGCAGGLPIGSLSSLSASRGGGAVDEAAGVEGISFGGEECKLLGGSWVKKGSRAQAGGSPAERSMVSAPSAAWAQTVEPEGQGDA
jgi:hypothetical protein